MPRVATASTSKSLKSPITGKTPPCPPLRFRCTAQGCPWSYARGSDLKRHNQRHMSTEEKEKHMIPCPMEGCTHKALQKSNMDTHYTAKHTGFRPHICPNCTYCAADPSCLHKHMRAKHDRVPGNERRRKRSGAVSDSFPYIAQPASSTPSTVSSPSSQSSSESSTSAWTPSPSPTEDLFSSPSPPAASSDEEFSLYSPPTTPEDALFSSYTSSPSSSSDIASLPASPSASGDWTWDPTFEAACLAMEIECSIPSVPPTAAAASPATLYPGAHIDLFGAGCVDSAAIFAPPLNLDLDLSIEQLLAEHLSLDFLPDEPTAYSFSSSSCDLPAFEGEWTLPAFQCEWDGVVF
ncbi:hypothetical protein B0H11DRAFT_1282154 [Mycena galericulata]|nr:hypothetical protein B0H11DRAFT_1282154 [Mycena galericulata]